MNNPDWMLSSRFPGTGPYQLLSSSTNSGRAQGQIDSTTAHNPIMQSLSVQSNHNSQHDQHGGVIENHYQYQQEGPLDEDLAEAEFRKMFGDDLQQIAETKNNLDEQHRAPDPRDLGQTGLSRDNLNRYQTNLAEVNTRDSATATRINQERAAQKGKIRVKSKGQIREVAGGVEYCFENDHSWHQAVYHDDIRAELIREASILGQYDHPRERGNAPDDVTSYLPSQKGWGPDRNQNWPGILHRLERRGLSVADYHVGNLYYNGRLVLDLDNNPILDYVDLPATLSTEFSGEYMEAITRLDPRISHKDFRARMPETRRIGRDGQTVRPSYSLSTIGMRMTRFRQEQGLISWTKREGSESIRDFLISNLPQENIEANSTRGVLPPSLVAQADSWSRNKGKYAARAGGRALSQKERQERDDKEAQKLAKLRTAEVESEGKTQVQVGEKRKRTACDSPDVDEVESANKRCKASSHSQIVHPMSGIPVPHRPCQSVPAPQKTRKRNRDILCSENDDERSTAKRQCRRSASPTQSFEKGDSGRKAGDATQIVVEEDLTLDNANCADITASFVTPEAFVVPETLAAPEVCVVLEPPTTPETRTVPDAPEIRVDTMESEGTSPLGFLYNLTAEELGFPEFGEEMTLAEFVQRDLEQMDCEAIAALEAISTPQETEEVTIPRHSFN